MACMNTPDVQNSWYPVTKYPFIRFCPSFGGAEKFGGINGYKKIDIIGQKWFIVTFNVFRPNVLAFAVCLN